MALDQVVQRGFFFNSIDDAELRINGFEVTGYQLIDIEYDARQGKNVGNFRDIGVTVPETEIQIFRISATLPEGGELVGDFTISVNTNLNTLRFVRVPRS